MLQSAQFTGSVAIELMCMRALLSDPEEPSRPGLLGRSVLPSARVTAIRPHLADHMQILPINDMNAQRTAIDLIQHIGQQSF